MEDQGWVAHLGINAHLGQPITIYGDGKQVRDLLYVDDLVRLFGMLYANRQKVTGKIYNVGGGPKNTLSLLEYMGLLRSRLGKPIKVCFEPWRLGDQKIFVASADCLWADLRWRPNVSVETGVELLLSWIKQNIAAIRRVRQLLNHAIKTA